MNWGVMIAGTALGLAIAMAMADGFALVIERRRKRLNSRKDRA